MAIADRLKKYGQYFLETPDRIGNAVENAYVNLNKPEDLSGLDYEDQLAVLKDRQRYADLLQTEADKPFDIQSYKGIQAPISPYAGAAKMLSSALAGWESGKVASEKKAAAAADRTAREEAERELSGVYFLPERAASVGTQGAQTGVDEEGTPQYATTPDVAAIAPMSQLRDPNELMAALANARGSANRYTREGAAKLMPYALKRVEEEEERTRATNRQSVLDARYDQERLDKIAEANAKRVADAVVKPPADPEIVRIAREIYPNDPEKQGAYIRANSPAAVAELRGRGQPGPGGFNVTPGIQLSDARALQAANVSANEARPVIDALKRSIAIYKSPDFKSSGIAMPEMSVIEGLLAAAGDPAALRKRTDINLLTATGALAGIAALAGIGGSDTERELAVATSTAFNPRGTREANLALAQSKLAAFTFAAEFPLMASEWISKYGSLHPTYKNEAGEPFARMVDRTWKRIQTETNAPEAKDSQPNGPAPDGWDQEDWNYADPGTVNRYKKP